MCGLQTTFIVVYMHLIPAIIIVTSFPLPKASQAASPARGSRFFRNIMYGHHRLQQIHATSYK